MPAIRPSALVDAILDAIHDSGYSGLLVSQVRAHPREFVVTAPNEKSFLLWVYIWTLTHGGRPSLPNEYRIQMTSVKSPLPLNPHGLTVLLGYEPDMGLFAGFDLNRHQTFTPGSASVQIDIHTVRDALQYGLSFDRKSNQEIAVGIRSDQFMNYGFTWNELHRYGKQAATFDLLKKASGLEDIADKEVAVLTAKRKRIVQEVSRLCRSGNFREQVLRAYGSRCAVTRAQLRLVDAAHILPVGAPESSDDVRNGLALAPTYHRAFDNGLVYLDERYVMRINPAKEAELVTRKLDGGVDAFKSHLGKILLPPDKRQWPNKSLVQKANRYRRIA